MAAALDLRYQALLGNEKIYRNQLTTGATFLIAYSSLNAPAEFPEYKVAVVATFSQSVV